MKLTENYIIKKSARNSYKCIENYKLKYKYESEHNNEIKTYKLTPDQIEEYLKKIR